MGIGIGIGTWVCLVVYMVMALQGMIYDCIGC